MPAEGEEVVLGPDPGQAQHLCEERAQKLLAHGDGPPSRVGGVVRHREGGPVELAVHHQWQPLQHHDRRRHHVVRQPACQVPAYLRLQPFAGGRAGVTGGDEVGRQTLVTGSVLTDDDHRLRHPVVPRQHRLDLTRLDPEAADLHLVVSAADV
ncbi:hypothetical protein GCM10010376_57640 [Streptomyces violaceusniger]